MSFRFACGTASRIVDYGPHRYRVGVFLQANFGSRAELVIAGVPVGRDLLEDNPMEADRRQVPAGAGLGANIAHLLPFAPVGATVILGMVAYFSGATQAPITSFVIVMEMTGNNTMLLPLMTASFLAYSTSRLICPNSVYHALSENFLKKRSAGTVTGG